jgi:hypothetical protein
MGRKGSEEENHIEKWEVEKKLKISSNSITILSHVTRIPIKL